MLKAILMVLLAVVGTSAAAGDSRWTWDTHVPRKKSETPPERSEVVNPNPVSEWVKVASRKTYNIFVNPAYAGKKGDIVTMVHLYELQMVDEVADRPFRSVKAQAEYNCMKQQTRTLSATAYSGSMGKSLAQNQINIFQAPTAATAKPNAKIGGSGVVNRISDPGRWKPITSGSTEEILWKYACGK